MSVQNKFDNYSNVSKIQPYLYFDLECTIFFISDTALIQTQQFATLSGL